ncbi:uncharacterized protein BX664DRAFT_387967 [Halteromyces radiatus]|uniref:uncharacterized protein n=1 Tax=Halteromyces radiatus TaxID=101107 RepID=UPI00221EE35B|nr:uncharacterized protein BX664DRAFT_387967 [Halteromyces radiatus]KAI8082831.1 hypothetical protein BX664DRAFT_387967 [Halteromyces radiatus]
MSSTLIFQVNCNGEQHQLELAKDQCNWTNFYNALKETLSLPANITPSESALYYLKDNNKQRIEDASDFAVLLMTLMDTKQTKAQLFYGDNNAEDGDWEWTPEGKDMDQTSNKQVPDDNHVSSPEYTTCYSRLGEVIDKHHSKITPDPFLRMVCRRLACKLIMRPDLTIINSLDTWLDGYDSNNTTTKNNNDNKKSCEHHDKKHSCMRNRQAFISLLPDDISKFLMTHHDGHHGRHSHHFYDSFLHEDDSMNNCHRGGKRRRHCMNKSFPFDILSDGKFGGPDDIFDMANGSRHDKKHGCKADKLRKLFEKLHNDDDGHHYHHGHHGHHHGRRGEHHHFGGRGEHHHFGRGRHHHFGGRGGHHHFGGRGEHHHFGRGGHHHFGGRGGHGGRPFSFGQPIPWAVQSHGDLYVNL